MTFIQPQMPDALRGLNGHNDIQDVARALNFGTVSTDINNLAGGSVFVSQSLEDTITVMTTQDSDYDVLNSIAKTQAGALVDEWNEINGLGVKRGLTVSNANYKAKEGQRTGDRRYLRLKFLASQWSILEALIKTPNFQPEANREDAAAMTRMYNDLASLIYVGDSAITSGDETGPLGGEEFDGIDAIPEDPELYSRYDGPLVYDCFTQGSGLDASGYSNPDDLAKGLNILAQRIAQPANGRGKTPKMYLGSSMRADVNDYAPFTPVQVLSGATQDIVSGRIVPGIANFFTPERITTFELDMFMPDSANNFFKSAQTRGEVIPSISPTVTPVVGTDVASRFDTGWNGTYYYFVAPIGIYVGDNGYEGVAVPSIASAVAVGGKVTLTITTGVGGKESGYAVYRSRRNGSTNVDDARLIKRVPRVPGASTTTFVDLNRKLPGAHTAYIVDWTNPSVVDLRYLFSPYRFPMPRQFSAPGNLPGIVVASYGLRARKHRHIAKITNYIPRNAPDGWTPR